MARDVNVLALVKGDQYYVYVYDEVSRGDLDAQFQQQAADPSLNFSPFDAAVLTRKADEQAQGQASLRI